MISLDMPSGPTTPLSVTESKPSAVITNARSTARYLDICAGRSHFCQSQPSMLGSQSWYPCMQSPCFAVRHMTLKIQTLLIMYSS